MYCAHCGTQNPDELAACDRCGELLIAPDRDHPHVLGLKECPACQTANDAHARFCVQCKELIDSVQPVAQPRATATPSRQPSPASRGARPARQPRVPRTEPATTPAGDLRAGPAPGAAAGNDSGTRQATLPEELKGWNWGAFLLGPVWGAFNRVWIALVPVVLVILPPAYMVLGMLATVGFSVLLGARGNQWAWRARHWDDADHFRRIQKSWMNWGLVALVVSLIWAAFAMAAGASPTA